MRPFLALPVWLAYRAMRHWLPPSHPWKTSIPFDDWAQHATQLCLEFGIAFGCAFVCFVALAARLVHLLFFPA